MTTFWPSTKPDSFKPRASPPANSHRKLLGVPGWRNPITGSAVCCVLATTGHAAAPPSPAMNSRRLISALQRFVGEPIAVQVPWERLSHEADGRLATQPAGATRRLPAQKKVLGGHPEKPRPRAGALHVSDGCCHASAAIAIFARRGSGPVARFPAREARTPGQDGKPLPQPPPARHRR
jgi:hypothetical protein